MLEYEAETLGWHLYHHRSMVLKALKTAGLDAEAKFQAETDPRRRQRLEREACRFRNLHDKFKGLCAR